MHSFQNNNINGDSRTFKRREASLSSLKCYYQGGSVKHGKYINRMKKSKYGNDTSHINDKIQNSN